jgi:CubicO group peptidase (beta-lactamase class C family)
MTQNFANRLLVLFILCLFFGLSPGYAQEQSQLKTNVPKKELIAKLEMVIPQLMEKAEVPGLSIAVIRDGKILWSRGFGIKNTKTGEPVTEDTIFEAASLT